MAKKKQTKISKATYDDIRGYLGSALREKFEDNDSYVYAIDFDESFVYFELSDYNGGSYSSKTYKLSYTVDGVNVSLGDEEPSHVVRESTYTAVTDTEATEESTEKAISKTIVEAIKDGFKSIMQLSDTNTYASLKSFNKDASGAYRINKFNSELQIAYDCLYCSPSVADSDGEAMSEDTIIKMVESLNKGIKAGTVKPNLFHKVNTDSFEFVEAFVNPWPSCFIDNTMVMKGQPVLVTHYKNKAAWELRKAGVLMGPSIGAVAGKVTEVIEEPIV